MKRPFLIFILLVGVIYLFYQGYLYFEKPPQETLKSLNERIRHQKTEKNTSTAEIKDDGHHLTFKGVPINGSKKAFQKALEAKGFAFEQEEDGTIWMTGEFAGEDNCRVAIRTLPSMNQVSHITAVFPKQSLRKAIFNQYSLLQRLLTEKYGQPTKTVDAYNIPSEMRKAEAALSMKEFLHGGAKTVYNIEKGSITLSIEATRYGSAAYVQLIYQDKKNSDELSKHISDDL